jgi:WD40 repeat protein
VRLWDVARRRVLGPPLQGQSGAVLDVAFSPDGKTLAAGGADNTILLWNVADRQPLVFSPIHGHVSGTGGDSIYSLAFSPNGQILASGGADGGIQLWNAADGVVVFSPYGYSHTGFLCCHGSADNQVYSPVMGLAFSPDGQTLASAGADHTVRLWDVRHQGQLGAPLAGHTDAVYSVAFNRQGSLLASGGLDGTVRLWDVRRRRPLGPPLNSHTGEVFSIVFDPAATTLAAGTSDGSIALWDVRQHEAPSATLAGDLGALDLVESVAVSPDGKTLAAGSLNLDDDSGKVLLWDLAGSTLRRTIELPSGVGSVAFSPDSRTLVVGELAPAMTVQLWDPQSGLPLGKPASTQGGAITEVAFSPDGHTVASASYDQTIQLWSVARQPRGLLRPLGATLSAHTSPSPVREAIAFSPDGRMLASNGGGRSILLWDVQHRRLLGTPLAGPPAQLIDGIAFSPDGRILAGAGANATVRLWDVARRQPLGLPLVGHTDSVLTVAFSPDGTILASGGGDNTVRLWDVASGQPLGAPLTGLGGQVMSLAFSPDGTTLFSGSWAGTVRVWDVDLASWPSRACRIANRNLTRQEWRQYVGDAPYHKTCPDAP